VSLCLPLLSIAINRVELSRDLLFIPLFAMGIVMLMYLVSNLDKSAPQACHDPCSEASWWAP
jgi:hypothetical protein